LIRDRFHTIRDFATLGRAYFAEDYDVEEKPLKKNVLKHPDLTTWMPMLAGRFADLSDFNQVSTEATARTLAEELEIKPGILINGMRTVLTGQLAGPSMFEILTTLGQKRVTERLEDIAHLYTL
jgi:glutamyl-tRNA synthetase